jgi:sugar phosphate isomerase/epimerase
MQGYWQVKPFTRYTDLNGTIAVRGVFRYNAHIKYQQYTGENMSITISAFGDEIASDFAEQLQTLNELNIPQLDLRQAWGVRVDNLTDEQVNQATELLKQHHISVACIGSPIGKSHLEVPVEDEINRLKRLGAIAPQLGTKNIRLFSFYPRAGEVNSVDVAYALIRLQTLVAEAEKLDLNLLLENEKGLVGDIPERIVPIFETINTPRLRFIWDPANFVQCKVANQVDEWWDALSPYIGYIHIKDAYLSDNTVCPAGDGDGQVDKLLQKLHETGYNGVLSLEPHLKEARHSSGFSGPELMKVAVDKLRVLMQTVGMSEE